MGMIEAVARAIAKDDITTSSPASSTNEEIASCVEGHWREYRGGAIAAIQAMRDPTSAMLQALFADQLDTKLGKNQAILDYDDMIRAALVDISDIA